MTVKARFILSMVLFGLTALVITGLVVATSAKVSHLEEQERLAVSVGLGASALGYLTDEYLLHREPEQAERWLTAWDSVSHDVESLDLRTFEQRTAADNIRASLAQSRAVFEDIVVVGNPSVAAGEPAVAFIQTTWGRMEVQNQNIASDSAWLLELLREQKSDVQRGSLGLATALLVIFGGYLVVVYTIMYRRTLVSLSDLLAGTEVIGSGKLDFEIPVRQTDEVGRLAQAFNRMTTDLRETTASRRDMEREVAERKTAEERLSRHYATEEGVSRILRKALTADSEEALGEACLEVATEITGSPMGFITELRPDGMLRSVAISELGREACNLYEQTGHRQQTADFSVHGLYGRVLTDGIPLFTNVPSEHPDSIGLPDGHPPLTAFLGVPLMSDERTIGVIGVGNREGGYAEEDMRALQTLAPAFVEAFARRRAEAALRAARSDLRLAADTANLGVFTWDIETGEGRAENERLLQLLGRTVDQGFPSAECLLADHLHPDDVPELLAAIEEGQRSGETVGVTSRFRGSGETEWRWLEVTGTFESGANESGGRVVGVVADVTERVEAGMLNASLEEIRTLATSTFDAQTIMHALADHGRRALGADSATILLREGDRWQVRYAVGLSNEIVGESFADDERYASVMAARQRQPVIVTDARNDDRVDRSLWQRLGEPRSLITISLIARGSVIGAVSFYYAKPASLLGPRLDFAAGLMSIAMLALDNADAYLRERTIADTLQQAILTPVADIDGISMAFLYRPATDDTVVGGDFYDVFEVGDDSVAIVVGDVSGKGIQAARHTSLLRDGARAYAYEYSDPSQVLHRLNHLFYHASPVEAFATVFFGMLDVQTGRLRFCCAGHPPAAVVRSDGVEFTPEQGGVLLGAFNNAPFETHEVDLSDGGILFLYTDGITEARTDDGELFGDERLAEELGTLRGTPLAGMPTRLLDRVLTFSGGVLRDDTAILCVSWVPIGEDGAVLAQGA